MDNMEFNKIFAAILVAGIIASLSGFIANEVIHPHEPEEDAYHIEGVETVGGAADAGPELPEPIMALLADASLTRGERLVRACTACHSFNQGGPDGTGPNLYNIINSKIAGKDGFSYSDAMAEKGGNWDYAALNHFLWRPRDYVPGTKMNFIGIRDAEDRAAVIAWLREQAGSPAALPSDAEIAEEQAALAPPEPDAPETETEAEAAPVTDAAK